MKSVILACVVLSLSGCAFGSVNLPDTCTTQQISFGPPPAIGPVSLGPTSTSATDVGAAIAKLKDVTKNLTVTVTSLTLDNSSGDLDFVSLATASITGGATDGSTPMAVLGTFSGTPGPTINLHLQMDQATLLRYLQSGDVTLTYTVKGNVTASNQPHSLLQNTVTMCYSSTGDFSL